MDTIEKMRLARCYPGGKAGAGVYQAIINQIPPHQVYVEPFLGAGAVMLRKRPAARNIGVELDAAAAARFAAMAGHAAGSGGEGPRVDVYCCSGVEWLKHAFGLYCVSCDRQPPNAAAWPASARLKPRMCSTMCSTSAPLDHTPPAGDSGSNGRADGSSTAAPFSGSIQALAAGSGDARSTDPARWFVYCDPPYLRCTRRTPLRRLYRHELDEAGHRELLDVLLRLPCLVAISGYWSPLYAAALERWRCITFNAPTRGGAVGKEHLWMNYAEPAELHDYRYLGQGKRQRERIARKVRTWSAGLARLPLLERQAIVSALLGPKASAAPSRGPSCRR